MDMSSLGVAPFQPRPPWWGGDLQTLANFVVRPRVDLAAWPARRIEFRLRDGSGDIILGSFHAPALVSGGAQRTGLAVLIHGLGGCEDSTYILQSAAHLLHGGTGVLRLNMRGAGPSRASCRGQYNAGASADLAEVLDQLPDVLGANGATGPIFAIGFSLGGNVLLKYLGEAGNEARLDVALAVSPPIDLTAASVQFRRPRNRLYQSWLLERIKSEAIAPGAGRSAAERSAIAAARSVWAFDEYFVAPHCGFANAAEYYERSSAAQFLASIRRPTVIVHSADDPWIPAAAFEEYPWDAQSHVSLILAPSGGHVGFHGRSSKIAWHNLLAHALLDRAFA